MSGKSKDGRTTSERKYKPIRREASRYGRIEKALSDLKTDMENDGGLRPFDAQLVSHRTKTMQTGTVSRIMSFTSGVEKGNVRGTYVFTGEPIRVDAG
jgi:hypothetical protein